MCHLEHVQVIDGTRAPSLADRNVVIEAGKITAILPGADEAPAQGTTLLDLRGDTIMPGIVGYDPKKLLESVRGRYGEY
jgi:imidazolonepropionase-like amidohydrolase